MYSFPNFEPVHCSMSSSNCYFLTCIQVFQEAGEVVWYSCLFKNFPQFVVIHRVKGFSVVNKAEIDVFLEFSCFFYDPTCVGILIFDSSAFSKFSLNIWKFSFHMLAREYSKSSNLGFNSTWTKNFQMFKLDLEKTGIRDQIANIHWIVEKAREF